MSSLCWSVGSFGGEYKDLIKALSEAMNSGKNAKIHVVWPYLEILIVEGVPIAFRGDLSAFSSEVSKVFITELNEAEVIAELEDKDYRKIGSINELMSLIKVLTAKEGLVLNGRLVPVVQLFDPSSAAVDNEFWESFTKDVDDPKSTLAELLFVDKPLAYNIVSLTDRWVLDILICREKVIGASLSMPEQVETITGADAFVYPLQSPGKWLITTAKSLLCPNIEIIPDPRLVEKAKNVGEGVVKL